VRAGLIGGFALLAAVLLWADSPAGRPAAPPIVSVRADGGGPGGHATGFAVGHGRVVTVAHVVDGAARLAVRAPGGPALAARVVRRDRRADLAVLAVPGMRGPRIRSVAPPADAPVWALVVRDDRLAWRRTQVRRAIVAHVRASPAERALTRPALELEARTRAGDSGAPVVTEGGRLAGVLFARSRSRAGTAYAVDAIALDRLLRDPVSPTSG
jgi:S1-C subfamily serine protease